MKSLVSRLALVLLTISCLLSIADGQKAKSSKDLPNLYQVTANLYRGGQPTEAGITELQKMGIKTVIDLRDMDDRSRKEEVLVKAAGMRFINVPLDPWLAPNSVFLDDLMKHFSVAENQPVFVHCKRGSDRTGVAIAVYRITHDGWDDENASAEAKKFGLGWWQVWMKDFIHDYYRDYKQKKGGH
ncbi:hypothetical protein BH10ACI2_BH10ACI2_14850 [soil metagenome]